MKLSFGTSHMLFYLFLRIQNIITPLQVVGRESLGCLVPGAPMFIMDDFQFLQRENTQGN
ncbi:hypothetical protein BP422_10685 [Brevibacillus formosus]|uniref:Uncharacterized protein n=1 Tax=Brevibacillus formosus TaxID=54913 RepID=A0A220MG87_9BACL|nr:hypothetical protein BP422_10685 [Brevibacillus formosus]